MAKRLRIEAEIPLPEDHFEAADVISSMRESIAHLEQAVANMQGSVSHSIVAERAPKKAKEETRVEPLVPRHGHAAE